ncbi:phosphoribosylglycinamide formyltransferase [Thermogutta sp.]|jgi:formyltetrahydrofolate-dependent phosphoribosylglycinamide formyltransferase|uniref:phosphoribosylglycinamide formyltransferase n=1 Tax=Thermogutta sp. TaxID=1962930 RepID=UPI003C7E6EFF
MVGDVRILPVAVLISGTGRTLRDLLKAVDEGRVPIDVRLVIASTPNASGLQYAEFMGIPAEVIERKDYDSSDAYSAAIYQRCKEIGAEYIIMAGFAIRLTIIPEFQNRVIGTHPALAPAFCGQGYFGRRVHEAVLEHGVKVTGCTVFFLDQEYNNGPVIIQKWIPVEPDDTVEKLEARVLKLETEALIEALQLLAENRIRVEGRRVRILPARPKQPTPA